MMGANTPEDDIIEFSPKPVFGMTLRTPDPENDPIPVRLNDT